MLFSTVGQSRVFLIMLYAGLALGLYASFDRAARLLFGAGRLLALIMDLIFGLAAAALTCLALLHAADGELRLYSLMGVLAGYLIYAGSLRQPVEGLMHLITRLLRAAFQWLNRRTFMKKLLK